MEKKRGTGSYYLAQKEELMEEFREFVKEAIRLWEPEFGADSAKEMAEEAIVAYEGLIPVFPDVGGEHNFLSYVIPFAARFAALYPPMRKKKKTAEDTGKLVYDLAELMQKKIPREIAVQQWEQFFSQSAYDRMERWTAWTRMRQYPGNWVCTFVRGNGRDFDFGIDYSECAVVKFLTALGVPELVPFVCINDFPESACNDSGLERTQAIGYGDKICNFRYKKGRKVTRNWSTEIAEIRSRSSR